MAISRTAHFQKLVNDNRSQIIYTLKNTSSFANKLHKSAFPNEDRLQSIINGYGSCIDQKSELVTFIAEHGSGFIPQIISALEQTENHSLVRLFHFFQIDDELQAYPDTNHESGGRKQQQNGSHSKIASVPTASRFGKGSSYPITRPLVKMGRVVVDIPALNTNETRFNTHSTVLPPYKRLDNEEFIAAPSSVSALPAEDNFVGYNIHKLKLDEGEPEESKTDSSCFENLLYQTKTCFQTLCFQQEQRESQPQSKNSDETKITFLKCCSFWDTFHVIQTITLGSWIDKVDHGNHYFGMRPCLHCVVKGSKNLLHAVLSIGNSHGAIECMQGIEKKLADLNLTSEEIKKVMLNLLQEQDNAGQTPIHVAAKNHGVRILEYISDKYQSVFLNFIEDNNGDTAFDLISLHTPNVACSILNDQALPTMFNDNDLCGNFDVEMDFSCIIGYEIPQTIDSNKQGNNTVCKTDDYSEMQRIAKVVLGDSESSKEYLSHVMVKTFLDLKWLKMRAFIYFYMTLKILGYLLYTLAVVDVFVAKCPISLSQPQSTSTVNSNTSGNSTLASKSFLGYLFGDYESAVQALAGLVGQDSQSNGPTCNFQYSARLCAFIMIAIILLLKELAEVLVMSRIKREGKSCGLYGYWGSWQNRFQIIHAFLVLFIGTLIIKTSIPSYYYSYAALSIILAWGLIFMELGDVFKVGIYVQLIGTIIKRFIVLLATYMCWIIAFSIALSLVFPRDRAYETLPRALLRVITMMSGDLNYQDTFYGNANQNDTPVVFTAQIIYASLALLLTIVLTNALIGLVVNDVQNLQEQSKVLHRESQVTTMYVTETILMLIRRWLPCLDKHMFVIQPKHFWEESEDGKLIRKGMLLGAKLGELNISKRRRDEIRTFAMKQKSNQMNRNKAGISPNSWPWGSNASLTMDMQDVQSMNILSRDMNNISIEFIRRS